MRHSCIFLLVGLLVVTWLQSGVTAGNANNQGNANLPGECCFNHYKSAIPYKKTVSYEKTRSECAIAGVIFITSKGLRICVNPNAKWVKTAMQQIDEKQLQRQF